MDGQTPSIFLFYLEWYCGNYSARFTVNQIWQILEFSAGKIRYEERRWSKDMLSLIPRVAYSVVYAILVALLILISADMPG